MRELLAGAGGVPDAEVSALAHADAYRLAGDQVLLVFEDGRGRFYESRTELLALVDEVERREAVHPLRALLPQGQAFAEQVPGLIRELAEQLDRPGTLDGTERSLDDLDRLVRRLGPGACLRPEQFARLVAYVGEVIAKTIGGAWRMVLAADGQTWEPWVIDARGTRYAPFGLVLKELHEWGPESSIRGVVAGHLWSRRN